MSNDKKVDFSNVQGSVKSTEADAPTKADFSNVQSSVKSTEDIIGSAEATSYTVKSGDTLSKIAKHHYGKASAWHAIYNANRDLLDDPDRIFPGQVLKIPASPDND